MLYDGMRLVAAVGVIPRHRLEGAMVFSRRAGAAHIFPLGFRRKGINVAGRQAASGALTFGEPRTKNLHGARLIRPRGAPHCCCSRVQTCRQCVHRSRWIQSDGRDAPAFSQAVKYPPGATDRDFDRPRYQRDGAEHTLLFVAGTPARSPPSDRALSALRHTGSAIRHLGARAKNLELPKYRLR